MFGEINEVTIPIAFLGGVVTFFASCLLPLIPSYLAFLSGISSNPKHTSHPSRWLLIQVASLFVLGFVAIFMLLGLSMRGVVYFLPFHRMWLERIIGVLFVYFGLSMLKALPVPLFLRERRWNVQRWLQALQVQVAGIKKYSDTISLKHSLRTMLADKKVQAVIFGMGFGLGWSPCIGPVLALILFMVARAGSNVEGILLLFVYGLGLGLPFIAVAAFYAQIDLIIKKSRLTSVILNYIAAGLLLLTGILLVTDTMTQIGFMLIDVFELRHISL